MHMLVIWLIVAVLLQRILLLQGHIAQKHFLCLYTTVNYCESIAIILTYKEFLLLPVVQLAQCCTADSGPGVDECTHHQTHSLQGVRLGETG